MLTPGPHNLKAFPRLVRAHRKQPLHDHRAGFSFARRICMAAVQSRKMSEDIGTQPDLLMGSVVLQTTLVEIFSLDLLLAIVKDHMVLQVGALKANVHDWLLW